MRQAWAVILGVTGAALVYDGFKGRKVWDDALSVLRGEVPKPSASSSTSGGSTAIANAATSSVVAAKSYAEARAALPRGNPTGLVPLKDYNGNPMPGQMLLPEAADAFYRAEQLIGRTIPITTAWRDYQSEADRNKQDPNRWPIPNFHTGGLAIDVYAATGLPGWLEAPSTNPDVIRALETVGFKRFDPDGKKKNDPMHWSFGVAG